MKDGARSAPVADVESHRALSVRRYNWRGETQPLTIDVLRKPFTGPVARNPQISDFGSVRGGLKNFAGRPFCAPALPLKTRSRFKDEGRLPGSAH